MYISHAAHIRILTVEIAMVKTRNEEGKERGAYTLIMRLLKVDEKANRGCALLRIIFEEEASHGSRSINHGFQ